MNRTLVYVTNSRIPSRRTNSIQVMKMCAAFAAMGVRTELVVPFRFRDWLGMVARRVDVWSWYDVVPGCFKLKLLRAPYPCHQSRKHRYSWMAAQYCRRRKPDLVYTRNIHVAHRLTVMNQRVVFESHDMARDKNEKVFASFISHCRRAHCRTRIVAISKALADAYRDVGMPPGKIAVFHDGVDLSRFAPPLNRDWTRKRLGLDDCRKLVCYAGSMSAVRGVDLLLEAIAGLENTSLVLAGGRPNELDSLKKKARRLGIEDRVILTGYIRHKEIPSLLSIADVLVMPSTTANRIAPYTSPMKMFEYMASCRPIVATDFPTIREVLIHEKNAILVEPDSIDSLREGIYRLLTDPVLCGRIAEKARKDVESYEWTRRAKGILDRFLPEN